MDFTFCICAYGDNPHLEACIKSVRNQTLPCRAIIATSTPSRYISDLAEKYGIPYFVNGEKRGIGPDWEFAIARAETPYAVIAHQDDIYMPEYAERVMMAFRRYPDSLIVFTDNGDLSGEKFLRNRLYLNVKRLLRWPFYLKNHLRSTFFKLSVSRFGNAICCPSVSYNLLRLRPVRFPDEWSINLDWMMWIKLAYCPGGFTYIPRVLMGHRIGDATETGSAIADNRRFNEDFAVFERLWGRFIAKVVMFFFRSCYRSNAER